MTEMMIVDIKYKRQYLDTFGDVEVTFSSIKKGEIRYKGQFKDGIILQAIEIGWESDFIGCLDITCGEKIKIRDLQPDVICLVKNDKVLHEFIVDELYMLDARQGIAFARGGATVIKVTHDRDSIFALKYVEQPKSPSFRSIVESLESELEKEILNGNGDKYKIATYKHPSELHHSNLQAIAENADIQTASY